MSESDDKTLEIIQPHAIELIERAQIDMQIATARKYPRDLATVRKKMLSFATLDEETAESCFYTLTREGKNIQGPSVRLAEIAVACYGNIRAASRLIDNDGQTVTSQGICHDLENNTLISVEVKRRITDKNGKTYKQDMQVVTGNAANSISFRNAVFRTIPGALIIPVLEEAKRVAVGNASTLSTKRTKLIGRLNSMQVSTDRILHKLGKSSVENLGLEDLEVLVGLGTAIKDGDTTVDEAFPMPEIQQPRRKSDNQLPLEAASDKTLDQLFESWNWQPAARMAGKATALKLGMAPQQFADLAGGKLAKLDSIDAIAFLSLFQLTREAVKLIGLSSTTAPLVGKVANLVLPKTLTEATEQELNAAIVKVESEAKK